MPSLSEILPRLEALRQYLSTFSDDQRWIISWGLGTIASLLLLTIGKRLAGLAASLTFRALRAGWRLVTPAKTWSPIGSNIRRAMRTQPVRIVAYDKPAKIFGVGFEGDLFVDFCRPRAISLNYRDVSRHLGRWEKSQIRLAARLRGEEYLRAKKAKEYSDLVQASYQAMLLKPADEDGLPAECYAAQQVAKEIDLSKMTDVLADAGGSVTLSREKVNNQPYLAGAQPGLWGDAKFTCTPGKDKDGKTVFHLHPVPAEPLKAASAGFAPKEQKQVDGDSIDRARRDNFHTGASAGITITDAYREVAHWEPERGDGSNKLSMKDVALEDRKETKAARTLRLVRELRALGLGAEEIHKRLKEADNEDDDNAAAVVSDS